MTPSSSDGLVEQILTEFRQDDGGKEDWSACGGQVDTCLRECMRRLESRDGLALGTVFNDLSGMIILAQESIKNVHHSKVHRKWRRLYTDASLLIGIYTLLDCDDGQSRSLRVLDTIRHLDMAIIVCGAPGQNRLEMIYTTISALQKDLPSLTPLPVTTSQEGDDYLIDHEPYCMASKSIKELKDLPNLSDYLKISHSEPFIVRSYATDWPALQDPNQLWSDVQYLALVAGPGRVVPVEIGSQYTESDWHQDIISWQDFLEASGWCSIDGNKLRSKDENKGVKYLAQHNLFTQFPSLEADIVIPDIIYSCPSAPSYFEGYKAPIDEEGLETAIINAWMGPKGTTTPAHFDPYFNAYVQVVGQKHVWVAPPDTLSRRGISLIDGNSSTLSIFEEQKAIQKDQVIAAEISAEAKKAILRPGDLLVLPPAWLHAMQSLTRSFSVSMWY